MKRLVLATRNANKVEEVRASLKELAGWTVTGQPETVPRIAETAPTFLANAILKATEVSRFVEDLTLADDSGLCVGALDGRPGVRSARYAPTDPERILKLLTELQSVPDQHRTAAFVCALALAQGGKLLWTVERKVNGRIHHAPAGEAGFGYDPIFWLPDFGKTMPN